MLGYSRIMGILGLGSMRRWRGPMALIVVPLAALSATIPAAADVPLPLAERVAQALGGEELLAVDVSVQVRATGTNYTGMNTYSAGGPPVRVSADEIIDLWQPATGRFRSQVHMTSFVPFAGNWQFVEAYDGQAATRRGPSDIRPGDDGVLAAPYVGARQKRLWMSHPQWLFARAAENGKGGGTGSEATDALVVTAFGVEWRMTIDPASGLPRTLEVTEIDGLRGQVVMRTDYRDWRRVAGLMFPFRVSHYTDSVLTRREIRREIAVKRDTAPEHFRAAEAAQAIDGAARDWGWEMSHWFLGRTAMARGSVTVRPAPVRLREIAPGLFHVTGTSHHNLVIVGPESLAVVDAPFYPARSGAVVAALRERWPGKAVRHLILTHHHPDHVGGMRTYIEAGAQLVVAAGSRQYFADILARNGIESPDILAVRDRDTLSGFGRAVALVTVPNSHAFHMLAVYLADEKMLYATDIYSPGRPRQHPTGPGELLQTIRYHGLDVESLIGGHGSGPDSHARFMEFAQ